MDVPETPAGCKMVEGRSKGGTGNQEPGTRGKEGAAGIEAVRQLRARGARFAAKITRIQGGK
jgi:hypothetical protein